jgi:alkaline phosphatase D
MKVRPLTLGPIVGATTPTSVRLWGRGEYEPTPAGPRRALGVARIRPKRPGGRYRPPVFFAMKPHFDMTGVAVLGELEPASLHEFQIGYVLSEDEPGESTPFEWDEANRSTFRTGTEDGSAPRSLVLGSCRYLLRLFSGWVLDTRGDKIFESILRQIDEDGLETDALLMVGDQIYADDMSFLFPDRLVDDFLKRYREAFGQPFVRELMSRVPTYMILDDHEIEDGWPAGATPADLRVKYPAAMHAYQIFQASHSPLFEVRGHAITGVPEKLWYRFRDGCCDFFVMDVRAERFLAERPEDRRLVSAGQMEALKSWLADGSGLAKLVVSSVPIFPETRGKENDHWAGFPHDRDEVLAHIVEHGIARVVFLSGDVHASMSAEIRTHAHPSGRETRIVSIVSSPFFWPYPDAPAHLFTLEGSLRAGNVTFELAEAGPVFSTDNFTRVTVHPDRVEVAVYARKGELLAPAKIHRFS